MMGLFALLPGNDAGRLWAPWNGRILVAHTVNSLFFPLVDG